MRIIHADRISEAVRELCVKTAYHLPEDVLEALRRAQDAETLERPKYILSRCIDNCHIARNEVYPLCQDTGAALFFVDIGEDLFIDGNIKDAINKGVRDAYLTGYLRKSIVGDSVFDRANTGDNAPAVIYFNYIKGGEIKIRFMAKGGGAENCAALGMLTPSQSAESMIDFVTQTVRKSGGKPCPPVIVGVGGGITADDAMVQSKRALFRKIGERNADPRYAEMEMAILAKINESGIGPQGLGGKTTALDVFIEQGHAHIASMAWGVSINCHSARHGGVTISGDGEISRLYPAVKADMTAPAQVTAPIKKVTLPLTKEDMEELNAGDLVSLSGTVYAARDAAHKRLRSAIQRGEPLPFDLKNAAVYYMGPSPAREGKPVGSCGPTTSARMSPYIPLMVENGQTALIGKGPLTDEAVKAMKGKAVCFAAIGGAGAFYAASVTSAETVAYEDLDAEAVRKLEVKDFECIVAIDAKGNSCL